jgi:hypothetical protein
VRNPRRDQRPCSILISIRFASAGELELFRIWATLPKSDAEWAEKGIKLSVSDVKPD